MSRRPLIAVVVSAALGGLVFMWAERSSAPIGCRLPRAEVEGDLDQRLSNARRLLDDGQYEAAERAYREMASSDGDSRVRSGWIQAQAEVTAFDRLTAVRSALDAGRFGQAEALLRIPLPSSRQVQRFSAVDRELRSRISQLSDEARTLVTKTHDAEAMQRLAEIVAQTEGASSFRLGRYYGERAKSALEELEHPELAVRRAFDDGDDNLALTRARSCAPKRRECAVLLGSLTTLSSQKARLAHLGVPRLRELVALCDSVSQEGEGSPLRDDIVDELVNRFTEVARKCRAAGDWACVDRQLAAAAELGGVLSDASYEEQLNAHARAELDKLGAKVADAAGRHRLARLLELTQIDDDVRDAALALSEDRAP